MKTNITLKIDDSLLREARIMAAQEDSSISAFLAHQLEQLVPQAKGLFGGSANSHGTHEASKTKGMDTACLAR